MKSSPIDLNHLQNMSDMLGDVFAQLIPAYIKGCDEAIEETPELIARQDFSVLERHYHSMKSSSRNIGANELALEAEKMEDQAKQQQLDRFSMSFENIKNNYQQVRQALIEYQQTI